MSLYNIIHIYIDDVKLYMNLVVLKIGGVH